MIIPRYIELKIASSTNIMTAEVEVKFTNYVNATGVTYGLYVYKIFEIVNTLDAEDKIFVAISSIESDASDRVFYMKIL